jgi:FkbM family methyltransferase
MIREALQRLGAHLAREFASYPQPEALSEHLRRLITHLEINCVLDVGAHVGQYVHLLREHVGFDGYIISFEPTSHSYQMLLRARRGDEWWQGHHIALGAANGLMELNCFSASTNLNSFLHPSQYGASRFSALGHVGHKESVRTFRLSDIFDEVTAHIHKPRVLLKIDTQGYDLKVLDGAASIADRILLLQVEAPALPIYAGMPSLPRVLDEVQELGFHLTGMFPVTLDRDGFRVVEFDCIAIR